MAHDPTIHAGGVVLHGDHGDIAVIHRPHRHDWSLPKGKLEPGESHALAAVRECLEETGCTAVLGPPLAEHRYLVDGVEKRVRSWRARAVAGAFTPNDEVDELRWVPAHLAAELLTHAADAELVAESLALPETTPLLVLRHADSVKRAAWRDVAAADGHPDDDADRPLSAGGLTQSDDLVPLLAAYGVTTAVTSDARRCRQTLEPYAALTGTRLRRDHRLSEDGCADDPDATGLAVSELLTGPPGPTVLCTHRPVLPLVIRSLVAALGLRPDSALAQELDSRLQPAHLLVLHRGPDGALVAVERHGA